MFDLGQAKGVSEREEQGRVVQLFDERGAPMDGVSMTVVGTYSERYRRAAEAKQDRNFRLGRLTPKPAELREQSMQIYAECVIAWEGFLDGGKDLPCNAANVLKVFQAAPWIMEQVTSAMEDHAGFSKASSMS